MSHKPARLRKLTVLIPALLVSASILAWSCFSPQGYPALAGGTEREVDSLLAQAATTHDHHDAPPPRGSCEVIHAYRLGMERYLSSPFVGVYNLERPTALPSSVLTAVSAPVREALVLFPENALHPFADLHLSLETLRI